MPAVGLFAPRQRCFALVVGDIGKRHDAFGPGKAVDGDGVGRDNIFHPDKIGILEMRFGVTLGGVADVAAFDVADDFDAHRVGLADEGVIGFDAFPEVALEVADVDLDSRDERGDDLDDLGAEFKQSVDLDGEVFLAALLAGTNGLRQAGIDRVYPDDQRRIFLFNRFTKTISKMTGHVYVLSDSIFS